jgi:hypothetical protein
MGEEYRWVAIDSKDHIPQWPIIGPWPVNFSRRLLAHKTLLFMSRGVEYGQCLTLGFSRA